MISGSRRAAATPSHGTSSPPTRFASSSPRSRERGEELAKRVGGELVPWEGVAAALRLPDIIVSSIGGADPVFTRPTVERSEERRVGKECRSRGSPYH